MKKYSRFITLFIFLALLAGCAKRTVDMKITDNGKVSVEVINAVTSSMAGDSEAEKERLKELGFKVEDYNDTTGGDLAGLKFSKTYDLNKISGDKKVIVDVGQIGDSDFDESQYFQVVKKGLFSTTYKATFIYDASTDENVGNETDSESDEDEDYDIDYSEYADSFEISYSVTLPRKAKSNNADSVSNNKYTWKVDYGEKKEITYEFEIINNTLVYSIAAVILVAIIVVVLVVIKKKKKDNTVPQPMQQQMPYQNNGQ